jgi:uncharacterized repeat protein (TIGR03806 family)
LPAAIRHAAIAGMALLAAACQPGGPQVSVPDPGFRPERLSDWGLLQRRGDRLVLGDRVEPYAVKTPLFSDYALKLRTYYLPPGGAMGYRDRGSFDFPVGSVVTKTFFYPERDGIAVAAQDWDGDVAGLDLTRHRLVETRLLVKRSDGWEALPYVWDGDDAYLRLTGAVQPMQISLPTGERTGLPYVVPARSECAGCHATNHTDGRLELIGIKARHVNRAYASDDPDQLTAWADRGDLTGLPGPDLVPDVPAWNDPEAPVDDRARAYLDANCGHCHNPAGAADTSGLLLDAHTTGFRQLGYCKPPIAAGRGTGGRPYSIVPGQPDDSILVYRMETTDPATRMPETGRSLTHGEGVELVRQWIETLPGRCV